MCECECVCVYVCVCVCVCTCVCMCVCVCVFLGGRNTFRPVYLCISNRDACCVAMFHVNNQVKGTKLCFSLGHIPFRYIEWLPLLCKSHLILLPLF